MLFPKVKYIDEILVRMSAEARETASKANAFFDNELKAALRHPVYGVLRNQSKDMIPVVLAAIRAPLLLIHK